MALVKKMELSNGIILDKSYSKIAEVVCNKEVINFTLVIYKDKECRILNKDSVQVKHYACTHNINFNSENSIKQSYEYLKTLDEYKDAIDDLDE